MILSQTYAREEDPGLHINGWVIFWTGSDYPHAVVWQLKKHVRIYWHGPKVIAFLQFDEKIGMRCRVLKVQKTGVSSRRVLNHAVRCLLLVTPQCVGYHSLVWATQHL